MKNVAAVIAGLCLALVLFQSIGSGVSAPWPSVVMGRGFPVLTEQSARAGWRLAVTGIRTLSRHSVLTQPALGIYTQVYQYRSAPRQQPEPASQSFLQTLRQQASTVFHQSKKTILSQGRQELLDQGKSQLQQSLDGAIRKPNLDASTVTKYTLSATLDAEAQNAQSEIRDRGPKLDSSGEVSAKMANYTSQLDQHSEKLDQVTQLYSDPVSLLQGSGGSGGLGQLSDKLLQHSGKSAPAPLARLVHGITDKSPRQTKPGKEPHSKEKAPHGLLAKVSSGVESVQSTVQHGSDRVTHGAGDLVKEGLTRVAKGNPVAERTAVALGAISATSRGIAAIIATVNDIVVQANLMAVNMVVDTAGATLKGGGYGAVGDDFTGLVKRTASVATRISDLVQDGVGSVQCLILPGGEKERQQALEKAVGQLSGVVQQMTAVATEQMLGLPQLNAAMQLVNKIARLNQDLLAEVTGLGQGLMRQTRRFFSVITSFSFQQEPDEFVPLRRAVATRNDFLQPPLYFADPDPYPFWR